MGSSNRQLSEVDAAAADANKDAVRVFRTKGVLWLEGDEHKHYVQGVRRLRQTSTNQPGVYASSDFGSAYVV